MTETTVVIISCWRRVSGRSGDISAPNVPKACSRASGIRECDATQIGRPDHERLRAAGFDDRGILQITLIASWFNYINRVADALGVGRD